jgi:rod shape-determining protein MreC
MKDKKFIIIGIIVLIILLLQVFKQPFFINKLFLPIQKLFFHFDKRISNSLDFLFTKKNLIEENERLKKEIARLIVENIKLKLIEEENENLKKELNFRKKENYQTILANVIGKKMEGGIEWFIIDRGEKDGVKEGFVAVKEGIVVGKVMKTSYDFSYLLPLLDERVKLAVLVVSPEGKIENKVEGLARGKNGLVVELDFVPLDKNIKENDLVFTSGLEYQIPKGLFVGTLKSVKSQSTSLFYQAIIEVPIKLDDVEILSIVIPKG